MYQLNTDYVYAHAYSFTSLSKDEWPQDTKNHCYQGHACVGIFSQSCLILTGATNTPCLKVTFLKLFEFSDLSALQMSKPLRWLSISFRRKFRRSRHIHTFLSGADWGGLMNSLLPSDRIFQSQRHSHGKGIVAVLYTHWLCIQEKADVCQGLAQKWCIETYTICSFVCVILELLLSWNSLHY